MNEIFKKRYAAYDGIDTNTFKHIPEISFYNNNYYIGLKRNNNVTHDLLFARSDDDNLTDWYIINGDSVTYIGYEYVDKCVLNIDDNKYT